VNIIEVNMLIGITGAIGSGKTLYMTRCLYKEGARNPDVRIATNYKLNNIKHDIIKASELFSLKQSLKDTVLGIDEMHIFMDCRDSLKLTNKMLTHFILQTRHLGVQLYFTTQDISQVDIRLRRMLDYLVYMSKTMHDGWFRLRIIDYTDVMQIKQTKQVFHGKDYYDLYDTTEIININD